FACFSWPRSSKTLMRMYSAVVEVGSWSSIETASSPRISQKRTSAEAPFSTVEADRARSSAVTGAHAGADARAGEAARSQTRVRRERDMRASDVYARGGFVSSDVTSCAPARMRKTSAAE